MLSPFQSKKSLNAVPFGWEFWTERDVVVAVFAGQICASDLQGIDPVWLDADLWVVDDLLWLARFFVEIEWTAISQCFLCHVCQLVVVAMFPVAVECFDAGLLDQSRHVTITAVHNLSLTSFAHRIDKIVGIFGVGSDVMY